MCRRILIALMGVVVATGFVSAQTTVPGGDVYGTWEASGSPYLVEGEITVPSDCTLTIQPAVEVNFQGHYMFIVNGYLEAVGTETDSILFTAANTTEGWHGLRFIEAQDFSHLDYCIVQYGKATGTDTLAINGGGILCLNSNPEISHSTIRWNDAQNFGGGIEILFESSPTISYCDVIENTAYSNGGIGGGWGDLAPVITHCTISGNSSAFVGGGIGLAGSPTITHCTISGNSTFYWAGGMAAYNAPPGNSTITNCVIENNTCLYAGTGGVGLDEGTVVTMDSCTIAGNSAVSAAGMWLGGTDQIVSNSTITGNTATGSDGGGVAFTGNSTATLENCIITNNSATLTGGGIYVNDSTPLIQGCTVDSNSSGSHGGGIMCTLDGNPTIQDCNIGWNTSGEFGGGIDCIGSSPTIEYCMLNDNHADSSGGGIDCYDNASPTITECDIINNTALRHGGGVQCYDTCNVIFTDCNISGNSCELTGGGIRIYNSSPQILGCDITNNTANTNGGGAQMDYSDAIIDGCTVSGNTAVAKRGGISFEYSSPTITNCTISYNTALGVGSSLGVGGIGYTNNSYPVISYCTIENNSAESGSTGGIGCTSSGGIISHCAIKNNIATYGGGVLLAYNATAVFEYCSISGNQAYSYGGGVHIYAVDNCLFNHCTIVGNSTTGYGASAIDLLIANVDLQNSIVANNSGGTAAIEFSGMSSSVTYTDFHDNAPADFIGSGVPTGIGTITGVNANGDPCDDYSNIYLDPEFVDPVSGDYNLLASSPCIDAGDPTSPPDSDGTIADMGAYFYDQGTVPIMGMTLIPYNPPIQIPASGGSFDYNIAAENLGASPTFTHAWCDVTLPNGSTYGPVIGPLQITMAVGMVIDRDRTQNVPAGAPTGTYTFNAYVGGYPDLVWAEDHFDFEKLATGDGVPVNDWNNYGEPFDDWMPVSESIEIPREYSLGQNYPNPFNPATTLAFALPEAAKVNLAVYDVSGRLVMTLIDGWRDAGNHQVTFDGSAQASGVYFYRFTTGQYEASGKMVLMK